MVKKKGMGTKSSRKSKRLDLEPPELPLMTPEDADVLDSYKKKLDDLPPPPKPNNLTMVEKLNNKKKSVVGVYLEPDDKPKLLPDKPPLEEKHKFSLFKKNSNLPPEPPKFEIPTIEEEKKPEKKFSFFGHKEKTQEPKKEELLLDIEEKSAKTGKLPDKISDFRLDIPDSKTKDDREPKKIIEDEPGKKVEHRGFSLFGHKDKKLEPKVDVSEDMQKIKETILEPIDNKPKEKSEKHRFSFFGKKKDDMQVPEIEIPGEKDDKPPKRMSDFDFKLPKEQEKKERPPEKIDLPDPVPDRKDGNKKFSLFGHKEKLKKPIAQAIPLHTKEERKSLLKPKSSKKVVKTSNKNKKESRNTKKQSAPKKIKSTPSKIVDDKIKKKQAELADMEKKLKDLQKLHKKKEKEFSNNKAQIEKMKNTHSVKLEIVSEKEKQLNEYKALLEQKLSKKRESDAKYKKEIEDLKRNTNIERERLENVKHTLTKLQNEIKVLEKKKEEALRLIEHKDQYFEKEYKKIDKLKDEVNKEKEALLRKEEKIKKVKEYHANLQNIENKITQESNEEIKHKKNINKLIKRELGLNQELAQKESELAAKEFALNEREKLLEEKSNTLLQLQNELLKEKHLIEEKKFNEIVNVAQKPNMKYEDVHVKFSSDQIYHMVSQASELIESGKYMEAKRLYNMIYENFQKLKINQTDKQSMELSINSLYNDLNLAILNQ